MATGASAQTSNFEGFSGAVKLNNVTTLLKIQDAEDSLSTGEQSLGGSVQAAFGFAVSPRAVISVGAEFGLGKNTALDSRSVGDNLKFETKDQLSVYLEPGWLISDTTLAYGKLSHEEAKFVQTAEGSKTTISRKGTGFGFGIRTMMGKASFLQVEVKQIGYGTYDAGKDESIKPKSTVGSIGVGFRF
jgi:hypothetical protein